MKLLLTSAGLTNESIAKALSELVDKSLDKVKVGFIPTAANVEEGDKAWFIEQSFDALNRYGFKWIDMVDPSASEIDWQSRLNDVDIIFVSGGNTFHLLNQFRKSGFDKWLKENLGSKVYVGISAGSIVVAPTIDVAAIEPADPNLPNITDLTGLNLVDFEIEPHCEGERFNIIKDYAESKDYTIYAIDDNSAVKVDGSSIEVISEGKWEKF